MDAAAERTGPESPGQGSPGQDNDAPMQGVASDMESIFGAASARRPAMGDRRAAPEVVPIQTRRRTPKMDWVARAAPLGLLGAAAVGAGIFMVRPPSFQQALSPTDAEMAGTDAPKPALAATVPPPVPARATPVAAPPAAAPAPEPVAKPDEVQPAALHPKAHRPMLTRTHYVRRERAGCETLGGNARAWCLRPALLAADQQLRRAYVEAMRAGLDRETLKSYRRRWVSLRHDSDDNPGYVIESYRVMAHQLNADARS